MTSEVKFLVIQLRQLGDILLTTPVLRAIKAEYPHAVVDFLVDPMGKLVLPGNPHLRDIHYLPKERFGMGWWKLLRRLRGEKYTFILDFMGNPRSAMLAFLIGGQARFAFGSLRRLFYTHVRSKPKVSVYIVREKLTLLEAIGVTPQGLLLPEIAVSEEGLTFGRQYWDQLDDMEAVSRRLRIILSPTHRRKDRRWPLEHYAQLASRLINEKKAHIVWIWGPGEEEVCKKAMNLLSSPYSHLAPNTSFDQMAGLMTASDLVIANSNGPSHVAAARAPYSFQIHGPTRLESWCPLSPKHQGIASEDGDIQSLGVDIVFSKLMNLGLFS